MGKRGKDKKKRKEGSGSTKYKPEYCEEIVKYFQTEPTKNEPRTILDKRGVPKEVSITIANKMPSLGRFCEMIGIRRHNTLQIDWVKKYPEFAEAVKRCKFYQQEFMDYLALNGFWDPRYTQYISAHTTGRQVQINSNVNQKVSGSVETVQRVISYPAQKPEGAPVG